MTFYSGTEVVMLVIDDTDESDSGQWVCSIENGFEPSITVEIQLSVYGMLLLIILHNEYCLVSSTADNCITLPVHLKGSHKGTFTF